MVSEVGDGGATPRPAARAPPVDRVNWLTSCGSLNNDDNEHTALLHVNPDDATAGQLVVTVRDPSDGVAWQIWTMTSAAK